MSLSLNMLPMYFNPLSPCGERLDGYVELDSETIFQSTLPVRGETPAPAELRRYYLHFNPLSPCGERRYDRLDNWLNEELFQSTLPVRGETEASEKEIDAFYKFQSTLPVRGETELMAHMTPVGFISIHSPRAGRDAYIIGGYPLQGISIHSPRAGRDAHKYLFDTLTTFISIHSPRAGRDNAGRFYGKIILISIHSPRAGRDTTVFTIEFIRWKFQSTLPVRGETIFKTHQRKK